MKPLVLLVILSALLYACADTNNLPTGESGEAAHNEGAEESDAQFAGELGEIAHNEANEGAGAQFAGELGEVAHDEGDEESAVQFTKANTYDAIRKGARLTLRFDPSANVFVGNVTNTTNQPLRRVRVEVHLSNGTELGPTTPRDLPAGNTMPIKLDALGEAFNTWSAHAEVG